MVTQRMGDVEYRYEKLHREGGVTFHPVFAIEYSAFISCLLSHWPVCHCAYTAFVLGKSKTRRWPALETSMFRRLIHPARFSISKTRPLLF